MTKETTAVAAREGREECLEALYRLERTTQTTSLESLRSNADLAAIDIPVTLLDLIERGDIEVDAGSIHLTRSGRSIGKRIYRRHEIAERFLRLLGLKHERAHREACRLEHIVTLPGEALAGLSEDDELSLISKLLNQGAVPLAHAAQGRLYRVGMVCGGRSARRKLEDLGVSRGAEVTLCTQAPRGPAEITVRGSRLALGRGIASRVLVVPVPSDRPDGHHSSRRFHHHRHHGHAARSRRRW